MVQKVKRLFKGPICVVGQGRWGGSLLAALRASGLEASAADPRKAAQAGKKSMWLDASVFWLCVPDAEISAAASLILEVVEAAGGSMRGRVLLHSSGVHSSQILDFAREKGVLVGSVHPMMSFPTRKRVELLKVPFAIEVQGPLKMKLFRLVRQLGGKPFAIGPEGKALYHAAAVMASPLLVSLMSAAGEVAALSGLSSTQIKELLQPMMLATLTNYFRDGVHKSSSGPFARGDASTVSLHLAALQPHPDLERVYRSLALHALQAMPVKNARELHRILQPVQRLSKAPRS